MSIRRNNGDILNGVMAPKLGDTAQFYCEKCNKKFTAKLQRRLFPKISFESFVGIDTSMWKEQKCPDCGTKCEIDKWWFVTKH